MEIIQSIYRKKVQLKFCIYNSYLCSKDKFTELYVIIACDVTNHKYEKKTPHK